jgi:hypothetical protein
MAFEKIWEDWDEMWCSRDEAEVKEVETEAEQEEMEKTKTLKKSKNIKERLRKVQVNRKG